MCIGLIPKPIKLMLRRQVKLHGWYARLLQTSGLFYGFPSPAKLQRLYKSTVIYQGKILAGITDNEVSTIIVHVIPNKNSNADGLECTLDYLASLDCELLVRNTSGYDDKIFQNRGLALLSHKKFQQSEYSSLLVLSVGERMHPKALNALFHNAREHQAEIVYGDSDSISKVGDRGNAELYPDWNPDLQISTAYIRSGAMLLGKEVITNWFTFYFKSSGQLSLALWLVSSYFDKIRYNIVHVPLVLSHRYQAPGTLEWSQLLASRLPKDAAMSSKKDGELVSIQWPLVNQPKVSLIIPTKNAWELVKVCIESILNKTEYSNYEILLIDNQSDEEESLAYFSSLEMHPKIKVIAYPYPFNYSAINNFAVTHATGEIIGLINNDIEVISPRWLTFMLGHVLRDDIGCVGAKLLYPDTRIQHAGVVMGYGGGAGHAHKYFPRYHPGYLHRLACSNNYSAVTAACLLVSKADFWAVGGLNEQDLTVAFNDVDFCLKVQALGRFNLYCAEAELFHHESVSRGMDDTTEKRQRFESELAYLQSTWKDVIAHDPAYNPNLTLRRENFSLKESNEY